MARLSFFVFLAAVSLVLLSTQATGLFRLDEIGYGDSYILYDVLHFQRTRVIYRDLSQPPYLAAQYSPLMYMLYALPKVHASSNPFLGPRLIALAAFLSCVAVVIWIVRAIIPVRFAWLWGLLLALSIKPMEPWVLQIRGDFPAIFFSLMAIRLLLIRSSYAATLAGLCAGFATQFKFTYVAALIAGTLWLLTRKKWREWLLFAAAAAISSIGLYFLLWMREPRMLAQMLAASPGVRDPLGCVKLVLQVADAPVILLAMAAPAAVVFRPWPRWRLLFLFTLVSFGIGLVLDIQAGGNVNYFFEALFAIVPFAALGVLRILSWTGKNAGLAVFLTGVAVASLLGEVQQDLHTAEIGPRALASRNNAFTRAEAALKGTHIFSTVPRLALLDREPALMEPFLCSYMDRIHKFNPEPILERVRRAEFDVAITDDYDIKWRGIPHLHPKLRQAILAAYQPYCDLNGSLIYLPRARAVGSALTQALDRAGCIRYPPPVFPEPFNAGTP